MADDLDPNNDPFFWLEEVLGEDALQWVATQNERTVAALTNTASFKQRQRRIKSILDSDQKIPSVAKRGDWYYNFWQDADNQKGVLRRTTLDEYRKDEPSWEVVLDIDALNRDEDENWVYKGSFMLYPAYERALINLSRGGADAVVVREFDLLNKQFIDEGFKLPEAKSDVTWLSRDELLVATDFGEGSLTESGYPRIVKLWQRDTPLAAAETIFEGDITDVAVNGFAILTEGFELHGVHRGLDFFHEEVFVRKPDGSLNKVDKPDDAHVTFHRDHALIDLRSDWQIGDDSFVSGSLLVAQREQLLGGTHAFEVIFEPTSNQSLVGYAPTLNHLIINVLSDVRNELRLFTSTGQGWQQEKLIENNEFESLNVAAVDPREEDTYFLNRSGFLRSNSLSLGEIGRGVTTLKRTPSMFDAAGLSVSQHWTESADGTRIPYFVVGPKDPIEPLPTLLYGYGGFEIPMLPAYLAVTGAAWLERGGVYVLANIRGGGEFGPGWHQAALRENRARAYEDFIAIAEDLLHRGVTTRDQLAASGGSNGGLLMGNMLTMRPDLFQALMIHVPLIDMYRYHKLLAGASWMAEYGNPEVPEEWQFIQSFSPYHNLQKGVRYPNLLVTTSTRDDRVHPGHARKLVAKLNTLGHDVWYYENTEGGHAGAADNTQAAFMNAMDYEFLWRVLGEQTASDS